MRLIALKTMDTLFNRLSNLFKPIKASCEVCGTWLNDEECYPIGIKSEQMACRWCYEELESKSLDKEQ